MYLKNHTQTVGLWLLKKTVICKKFLKFLLQRIESGTIFRVAAALSYTSLIAVVPVIAIGLAIFSAFPVFSNAKEQLQEIVLQNFVPNIEQEITQYFSEFINATAQLTTIGVIGIAITAILMLSTIENSLNFIFKVYKPRNIKTKITLYWTVITLGPLLIGVAMSMRGYLYALQQFMPEDIVNSGFYIGTLLPSFFTTLSLVLLYVLVPNKKVRVIHAFIGAAIAVFMFYLLRKFFGQIISASATYKTLYGAMATLPILLVWIYCSWIVVLFGAVMTASLDEFRNPTSGGVIVKTYPSRYKNNKNKHREKKFLPKEQK